MAEGTLFKDVNEMPFDSAVFWLSLKQNQLRQCRLEKTDTALLERDGIKLGPARRKYSDHSIVD